MTTQTDIMPAPAPDDRLIIHYGERALGGGAGEQMRKLSKALPWYGWRGKIGASHSFIQLRTADGRVLQQIHGMSCLDGALAPDINSRVKAAAQAAIRPTNTTLWNKAVRLGTSPAMKLYAVIGDGADPILNFLSSPDTNSRTLLEGQARDVLPLWHKALAAAHTINHADLPFSGYGIIFPGQTCNTVSRSLIEAMGISTNIPSPHVRAGYGRSLRALFSAVAEPSGEVAALNSLAARAMEPVQPFVAEGHARFASKAERQKKLGKLL